MRRNRVVAAVVALAFVLMMAWPRPARAGNDYTLPLIISGAIAGTVALVALIAIMFADREDPEWAPLVPEDTAQTDRQEPSGVRFAHHCRPDGGNVALFCW